MCQESVFKFLKQKKRWVRSKEIPPELGISQSSVMLSLKKLHKYGFIERKELKYNPKWYEWRVKQ
jgi:predicted transcriptional regulator